MNKKALEMAMGTIVAVVLGLIVLVILIIFVQQQVAKGGQKIGTIEQEAEFAVDKCQSLIKGTFCSKEACTGEYENNPAPPGGWADCGKTKELEDKKNCCRKKTTA